MSEFSNTSEKRLQKLMELSKILLETGNARNFILNNQDFIDTVIPQDFLSLFDELVKQEYPMEELKVSVNKILNIFHLQIERYNRISPSPESFLGILERNNAEMENILNSIRPVFKAFMQSKTDTIQINKLIELFSQLEKYNKHYIIKENILFPMLEKQWSDFRCIQIMWSFHDDIRKNIKFVLNQLNKGIADIQEFNRSIGDIFFDMLSIKFREERILFPYIMQSISPEVLDNMKQEGTEMGYPYIHPQNNPLQKIGVSMDTKIADLGTGKLSVEQIKLIFDHLPVDITYVDENDEVCYFSTPKKRIFPRTTAIIGRKVSNCHPPESVHVVERIVQSFKSGEKNSASFWIRMKGQVLLIQYFAVRDEQQIYKGVVEVSQDISEIQTLEGEKRLLDW